MNQTKTDDSFTCKEIDPDSFLTKSDYQFAMDSQCACNLSGIVHSLSAITNKIWEEARRLEKGTDWVNSHPICRLFAEQILYLSGLSREYGEAHDIVNDIIKN